MQNRWDDHNCDSVDYGPFRGMYELTADTGNAYDNGFPGDHHPGGGGHGPHH
ncbi:MAG TPA: hypothetical protein VGD29_33100 [Actinoplanes sp.]